MRASAGPYSVQMIKNACGGTILHGMVDDAFTAITTDSRDVKPGDLFIPLAGANFDGHDYIVPALEAGARGCLTNRDVTREIPRKLTKYVLIQVKDTLRALSDLASAYRRLHPIPLIAVTGSSGKTTVKEMIASGLRQTSQPLVSQANYNNLIGLPMTVLNLNHRHSSAVVEAGINVPGEMDLLSYSALPDVAVITTIGPVHLEGLGSIENVAREKSKICSGLTENGKVVVPSDNPLLLDLCKTYGREIVTFGFQNADFTAADIQFGDRTEFTLKSPQCQLRITLSLPGWHNVLNVLAAAAAISSLGFDLTSFDQAIAGFRAPSWRMELIPFGQNKLLIRDCYNANPQSMAAALDVLAKKTRARSLAVLGDMLELGEESGKLHGFIGETAAKLRISHIVYVGTYGADFAEGFIRENGNSDQIYIAQDKADAWDRMQLLLPSTDAVLVKGSRSMKMEILADRILEEF